MSTYPYRVVFILSWVQWLATTLLHTTRRRSEAGNIYNAIRHRRTGLPSPLWLFLNPITRGGYFLHVGILLREVIPEEAAQNLHSKGGRTREDLDDEGNAGAMRCCMCWLAPVVMRPIRLQQLPSVNGHAILYCRP